MLVAARLGSVSKNGSVGKKSKMLTVTYLHGRGVVVFAVLLLLLLAGKMKTAFDNGEGSDRLHTTVATASASVVVGLGERVRLKRWLPSEVHAPGRAGRGVYPGHTSPITHEESRSRDIFTII